MKPTHLKNALEQMFRNPVLAAASVGTVAFTLAIFAVFLIILANVEQVSEYWRNEVQVVAYLPQGASAASQNEWRQHISAFPEVQQVREIDQESAFLRFRQQMGDRADLLEGVEASILPASFEVVLREEHRTFDAAAAVAERIRKNLQLDDVEYGAGWLERFQIFMRMIRVAGLLGGGFLLCATLFLVTNTIRLAAMARYEELEIMWLIGATRAYIKIPFVIEGLMQGAAGALVALTTSWIMYRAVMIEGLLSFLHLPSGQGVLFLTHVQLAALLLGGTLLGGLASLFALRRLLR